MKTFAILGVAGYIAPKHLAAIKAIGGNLIAVVDPNDNVEILDNFFPDCEFLKTVTELEEYLETNPVDYLVVCTPTHLHKEHLIWGLQKNMNVICESPLVLKYKDLQTIIDTEVTSNRKVFPILNYRYNKPLEEVKQVIKSNTVNNIKINIETHRGKWFKKSWKGIPEYSGGILFALGYHIFDYLISIWGSPSLFQIKHGNNDEIEGEICFNKKAIQFNFTYKSNKDDHTLSKIMTVNEKVFSFNQQDTNSLELAYNDIINNSYTDISGLSELIKLLEKYKYTYEK